MSVGHVKTKTNKLASIIFVVVCCTKAQTAPGTSRPSSVAILIFTSGIVKLTAKLDWLGTSTNSWGKSKGCQLVKSVSQSVKC